MKKNKFAQDLTKVLTLISALFFMGCQTLNQKDKMATQPPASAEQSHETAQQPKTPETQKLKWDMHPDQDGTVVGYRIYLKNKKAKKGTLLIDLKDPKATELPLTYLGQINEEKANYLYLTVYDQKNIESKPSEMICVGKKCPQSKTEHQQK